MKNLILFISIILLGFIHTKGQNLRFYGVVVNNGTTTEVQLYGYNSAAGTESLAGPTIAIYYDNTESIYQSFDLSPMSSMGWTPDQTISAFATINNGAIGISHTGNREFQAIDQTFTGSNIGQTPVHLFSVIFDNTPGTAAASAFELAGTNQGHPAMAYVRNDFTGHPVIIVNGSFPVELLDFEAKAIEGNRSLLTWTTATELNNKGFQIESKSSDPNSSNWAQLGFVEGHGTTDKMIDYSFIDPNPQPGENLYRLRQIDFNGDFDYSEVRTVWFDQGVGVNVYPNPASSFVNVKFEEINPDNDTATYDLLDMRGRNVASGKLNTHRVSQIDISKLPEGTYLLKLFYLGKTSVKEIIKID
ncbi:MAG: T9SS type A sorting domain-containing protein [Bacteroidetes bacterium]|nr:T9SS type A sorting domain-containing protein [Bacteroidota bacterium]MCB0855011.1 T9SS type A sorting domain-containing protein [Bacteroidota bacterium]